MEIVQANPHALVADERQGGVGPGPGPGGGERKTGLYSPNMLINSHKEEVYSVNFSSDGKFIASGSLDMTIMVHNVYNECETLSVLSGHKNAVLQAKWCRDDTHICSASADFNAFLWDVENELKVRSFKGHTSIVNGLDVINYNLFATCSDDSTVKIWDFRCKKCVHTVTSDCPFLAICSDKKGESFYVSSTDDKISKYSITTGELEDTFTGHKHYISGLAVNNEETVLASLSADETICLWDIQPFPCDDKLLFQLPAPRFNIDYNLIKLSFNNDRFLACGSGDNHLYIYDYKEKILMYTLPGHTSTINDVAFHPYEDIVVSCSSDKTIFLGEL
ncbi:U5 snrnp-specific protein, putative [Plasmodium knowlesi strain H]|uniref:U5 snrnp-specific protein, putative n=3 Tax=Plasmodium knowlesi TaxID=5850 RepID=A0A5K1UNE4_PLAKH|nr:U5 small nuclear ribonucleoprotein 40 kDa protein, putative [Plasmodium knowlesi strain H]OTN67928.1 putative U5 snrnp-specific protein [Plasmodium knowlesi]CAA9990206.1 U5 small nuclear ribonucleoprotein 40 kDa protein, putative [Plasmodium knowlesi strain H]SBO27490.1 U5 snrnp-specific protein, putative [Plasmodium knowlesi strain H]SBO28470.1 U5 snrnp-specific protein, putative [Plasmodium knowlesi strain H]VVS79680.1 U5 small nuclear ribonucleoprotein 40 kDa protein, putative [Plasmodiu|eukprot:XP_002258095.1 U5 snrnp-specific protein, putative [Plasmodium knowlesi strain H]